ETTEPVPASSMTAQAVADLVGGRLSGNGAEAVRRLRSLEAAADGDIAVCSSTRYAAAMAASHAAVVIVSTDLEGHPGPATRIVVDDINGAAAAVAARFHPPALPAAGVHPTAVIGDDTRLGE